MRNILLLIFCSIVFFGSCKEEEVGQFPVDSVKPQKVSNVVVNNLPGKVEISYTLPNETDLLYVKAAYINAMGVKKEVRASVFKNKMVIKGFGKSKLQTIQLISVDRSRNESEPVTIEIEPEDSPIYNIFESLDIQESWGGIKILWDNPLQEEIVLQAFYKDEKGKYAELESFYTAVPEGNSSIRGLGPTPHSFAFFIRDTYGNRTDTLKTEKTPRFEMELPGKDFRECNMPTGTVHSPWGKPFACLFDGKVNQTFKDDIDGRYYINCEKGATYFTFDMKQTYQFSRFKLWGRSYYPFGLNNPKDYEIWGSNDENAPFYPDSWEGWTKLIECHESVPSGNAPANATNSDKLYYTEGMEYEFSNDVIPVRYVRFKMLKAWTESSTSMHIVELRFWGKNATTETKTE